MNNILGTETRIISSKWYIIVPLMLAIILGFLTATSIPYSIFLLVILLAVILLSCILIFAAWDPFLVLSVVILLIPFHTIIDNIVAKSFDSETVTILFSAWKELILIILIFVWLTHRLISNPDKFKVSFPLLFLLGFSLWGIFFIPSANNLKIALLEYRNIYEGILVFLAVYLIRPPLERVVSLFQWIVGQGVILALWGVISRYILDFHAYLVNFGFISPDITPAQLRYSSVYSVSGGYLVRANSIFSGPNEFGLYLAAIMVPLIAFIVFRRNKLKPVQFRWYIVALAIIGVGELISVSRNSWILIFVACMTMYIWIKGNNRKIVIALAVSLLILIALIWIPNLWELVIRTVTLQDSSAAGRIPILQENLAVVSANPFGIGLGNASYKFYQSTASYVHTEFYVLLIALELGWIGLILYLLSIGVAIYSCYHITQVSELFERRLFALIGMSLLLGTLVSQFTSAISMEWIFQLYLWFFVGVALYGILPLKRSAIY